MIAVIVVITVAYQNNTKKNIPIVFSTKTMIDSIWQRYKDVYLEKDTYRTFDPDRGMVTTSEGEAYTLLRSVWLDDHVTFDKSWLWTKNNLQKKGYLFAWLFGKRSDGSYGILTERNGQNSASDADTDIGLSLALAFARWRDPQYLAAAKNIIVDVWNNEVIVIKGRPYLAADNVQKRYTSDIVINPSYFSPYAYRIFAAIDPAHDWKGLVDTSYEVLRQSMRSPLELDSTAGLPPNWIAINRTDASIRVISAQVAAQNLDTNFSYDALRIPWRIALDWYWYKEPRAKETLAALTFLDTEWKSKSALYAGYKHNGAPLVTVETPAMYGGTIGTFMVTNPTEAKEVYENKLLFLYNPDSNSWKKQLSYYDDNWAWFGMALYNNELPNLWATVYK